MRIGCIGLGHIGGHLAANPPAAGHEVPSTTSIVDLRAPGFPATLEEYLATMPRAESDDERGSG